MLANVGPSVVDRSWNYWLLDLAQEARRQTDSQQEQGPDTLVGGGGHALGGVERGKGAEGVVLRVQAPLTRCGMRMEL
jgi:hypothetical protein